MVMGMRIPRRALHAGVVHVLVLLGGCFRGWDGVVEEEEEEEAEEVEGLCAVA